MVKIISVVGARPNFMKPIFKNIFEYRLFPSVMRMLRLVHEQGPYMDCASE